MISPYFCNTNVFYIFIPPFSTQISASDTTFIGDILNNIIGIYLHGVYIDVEVLNIISLNHVLLRH